MQDFTIVRKGFEPTEVDTYIVSLESQIEKLNKRIEEYRTKEDAINRAVIDAQLIADAIVTKAKEEASSLKEQATAELEDLRIKGLKLRENMTEFQESYNRVLRRYLYAAHCEDMHQIYDRLDTVLKEMGVEEKDIAPAPQIQAEPSEEFPSVFSAEDAEEPTHTDENSPAAKSLDELNGVVRPMDTTKGM